MLGTDFLQDEHYKPDQIVTISREQNNSAEYSGWKKNTARFMKTLFMVGLISTTPGSYAQLSRKSNSASSASEIDGLNGSLLNNLPNDAELYLDNDSTTIAPLIMQIPAPYVDTTFNNIPWWDEDNKYKIYQDEISDIKLKCTPNSSGEEQDRLKLYLKDMKGWLDSKEEEGKTCFPYEEGRCKYKKLYLLKNAFCNQERQTNIKAQLEGIPDTRNMLKLDAYNALPELIVPKLTDSLLDEINVSCEKTQAIYAKNNHWLNYLSQLLNANIKKFIQLIKDAELTPQIETLELENQADAMYDEIKDVIKYFDRTSPEVCEKVQEIWGEVLPFLVVETIDDMRLSLKEDDNILMGVLDAYSFHRSGIREYVDNVDQLVDILYQWTDHHTVNPNNKIIHQKISNKIEEHQKKYSYKKLFDPFDDLDAVDGMIFMMKLHNKLISIHFFKTKRAINKVLSHYKTQGAPGEKREEILLFAENILQQEKTIEHVQAIQKNLFETLPYTPIKLQATDPDFFSDTDINSDSINNKNLPSFRKIIDEL